jgi:CHASE3 domain sensor protein
MMNSISIKVKFFASFAIMLVLICGVGAFSLLGIRKPRGTQPL